jgi:hypothetical protein
VDLGALIDVDPAPKHLVRRGHRQPATSPDEPAAEIIMLMALH